MIDAFGKAGLTAAALTYFRMLKAAKLQPNIVTYNSLMKAYHVANRLDMMLKVLLHMIRRGVDPDTITFSILIDAYGSEGKISFAIEFLDVMEMLQVKPNVVTYNTLIKSFALKGNESEMEEYLTRMQEEQITPDVVTFTCLLHGFARANNEKKMLQYYNILIDRFKPTVKVFNVLLRFFAKKSHIDLMEYYYNEMQQHQLEPDSETYTIVVRGYLRVGTIEKAIGCFDRLLSQSDIIPDVKLCNRILAALSKTSRVAKMKTYTAQLQQRGVVLNEETYHIIDS